MADSFLLQQDKKSTQFSSYYQSLCALQSTYPLASIKNSTEEGILNCDTYKLKRLDWGPLLTALRANRVLHAVIFHDKWEERAQHCLNDDTVRARLPLRLTNRTTDNQTINEIIRSLKPFLCHSRSITSLLLEGLSLELRNIKLLAKGLEKNQSLKWLSLKGSGAGDKGVEILCQVLKHSHMIEWVDLTWCHLTSNGMNVLSELIRYQSLHRQSSVWKNSLRGGHPQYHTVSGLKRLTLNLNPNIRDSGATLLAHALEDDVWIKALDMQTCGLTTTSAKIFQSLLQSSNTGLEVLDIRENALVDDEEIDTIIELLTKKEASTYNGHKETYKWLDVEVLRIQKELKSTGVPMHVKKKRNAGKNKTASWPKKKGLPWRTAGRSSQRWRNSLPKSISASHQSETTTNIKTTSYSSSSISTSSIDTSSHHNPLEAPPHSRPQYTYSNTSFTTTSEGSCPVQVTLTLNQFKEIQRELKLCHLKLREDEQIMLQMKAKIDQLEEENRLLKDTTLREEQSKSLDESTIQNIESTFEQFHAFLDLLSKKGYGHLTQLINSN